MAKVEVRVGLERFIASLHPEQAPRTVEHFQRRLPFRGNLLHVRWSGAATWIPLGLAPIDLPPENCASHVSVGQTLLYTGGLSEAEILIPYGPSAFGSAAGPLAGNHFMTIADPGDRLRHVGKAALWQGVQQIEFRPITSTPQLAQLDPPDELTVTPR